MNDAREHYRRLLAPIYVWMVGGVDAALARQRELARALGLSGRGGRALDLGAGFGATALALAELGWEVTAVDASDELLAELERLRGAAPIRCARADLVEFAERDSERYELALCLGDTLTHLESEARVLALFGALRERVAAGGRLVLSFRDYAARTLEGPERFVHVRSDSQRSLTCFLDYRGEQVLVHDVLHERDGEGWRMSVSAYPKLRLAPDWVVAQLASRGFALERRGLEHGLSTLSFVRR